MAHAIIGYGRPTTGTATAAKAFGDYSNPIIDYWYGADPWAMEYNGRVYIYTTGDGTSVNADGSLNYDYEYDSTGQIKDNSFAQVKTINVLSSDDMVNWRNEGYIRVAGEQGVATWASNSWAPAVAHKTINGKEKFFLYFANGGSGIGVLTSDSPVGPWKDETGELLIKGGTPEWGIPAGGDCRKAIQPVPLDFRPTEHTCQEGERLCLSPCPTASVKV